MIFGKGIIALHELVAGVIAQWQIECLSLASEALGSALYKWKGKERLQETPGAGSFVRVLAPNPEPSSPAPAFQLFINQWDNVLCRPASRRQEQKGQFKVIIGYLASLRPSLNLGGSGNNRVF